MEIERKEWAGDSWLWSRQFCGTVDSISRTPVIQILP